MVRNCRMRAGHGGVTIGSEVSGGARDVYAERCVMSSPQLDRGLRIKTNAMRGGVIENVFVRDVEIGEVGSAVDIDMRYEEGDAGPFVPVVRNVQVERMTVGKAGHALFVRALPRSPVTGLAVRDSRFSGLRTGSRLDGIGDLALENVIMDAAPAKEARPCAFARRPDGAGHRRLPRPGRRHRRRPGRSGRERGRARQRHLAGRDLTPLSRARPQGGGTGSPTWPISGAPESLIEGTVAALGGLDILVNNAGIIRRAPAAETTDEDWDSGDGRGPERVFRLARGAGRHAGPGGVAASSTWPPCCPSRAASGCRPTPRPSTPWPG